MRRTSFWNLGAPIYGVGMTTLTTCAVCGGSLTLVRNNDRSLTDPASYMKYVCANDDDHVFEDPDTMPRDNRRTFG
jgi:hypothetical protein